MGYKNALNYTKQDKTTEPRWELRLGYPDGEQVRKTRTEWKSLRDRALPPKANETELASLRKNKPSKLKAKYSHVAVNLLRFTVSSEQPAQNSHPPLPSYFLKAFEHWQYPSAYLCPYACHSGEPRCFSGIKPGNGQSQASG